MASVSDVIASDSRVIASGGDVIASGGRVIASVSDVIASGGRVIASDSRVIASGGDVIASGSRVIESGGDVIRTGRAATPSDAIPLVLEGLRSGLAVWPHPRPLLRLCSAQVSARRAVTESAEIDG